MRGVHLFGRRDERPRVALICALHRRCHQRAALQIDGRLGLRVTYVRPSFILPILASGPLGLAHSLFEVASSACTPRLRPSASCSPTLRRGAADTPGRLSPCPGAHATRQCGVGFQRRRVDRDHTALQTYRPPPGAAGQTTRPFPPGRSNKVVLHGLACICQDRRCDAADSFKCLYICP